MKVRPGCVCELSSGGAKLLKIDGISEGDLLWVARRKSSSRTTTFATDGLSLFSWDWEANVIKSANLPKAIEHLRHGT